MKQCRWKEELHYHALEKFIVLDLYTYTILSASISLASFVLPVTSFLFPDTVVRRIQDYIKIKYSVMTKTKLI